MLFSNKDGQMLTLSSKDSLEAQLKQWELVKTHHKLKSRIRKGVPQALRGTVWQNLCGSKERRLEHYKKGKTVDLYFDLVRHSESPHHDLIWKDINRTYRKQARFGMVGLTQTLRSHSHSHSHSHSCSQSQLQTQTQTQTQLQTQNRTQSQSQSSTDNYNNKHDHDGHGTTNDVLKSSSSYETENHKAISESKEEDPTGEITFLHRDMIQDSDQIVSHLDLESTPRTHKSNVGYCQGMQSIAALMLMHLTEEEAFWVLVSLADDPKYSMDVLWQSSMPGIGLRFYQLERLVRLKMSKLASHLEEEGANNPATYQATQWFVTGFLATSMRFDCLMRIWDIYLSEGLKTMFRFGLGLLKYFENDLLNSNFEEMAEIFQNGPASLNVEEYIGLCLHKIKVTHAELNALERQYNTTSKLKK
ncbi:TBC domain-containing protein [Reticulomyxa filosa]|uniref:TBC domain-containing protein n=1 Tax=Reticulomyxa filosa TaxID=46433 RepID=X6MAW9_RETFI|nr:TBC domain-containing protein [Reticulomyxa filosa]|eukprot:ETO10185.1 TBC domain-containing protein [Reticulomyxa filosa]